MTLTITIYRQPSGSWSAVIRWDGVYGGTVNGAADETAAMTKALSIAMDAFSNGEWGQA